MSYTECRYRWLGQVEYQKAWDIQKSLVDARAEKESKDTILFLEHPPTYTLGRRGDQANLLVNNDQLRALGAVLHRVDRGGDITFHGPGQLVAYPILDLERLGISVIGYVRGLEDVLINAVSVFGVDAGRLRGFPGVWVGNEKVAAIGIKLNSRRITSHGFALNVNNDLRYFTNIVPCGLKGKIVTSLAHLKGREIPIMNVLKRVISAFGEVFNMVMREENGSDS